MKKENSKEAKAIEPKKSGVMDVVADLIKDYRKKDIDVSNGHVECDFFDSGNIALNYVLSGNFDFGWPVGQVVNVHGLSQCLVSGTKVVLGDGSIVDIESLGKNHLDKINFKVMTDTVDDVATVFHHYKSKKVIEVITESGKKIIGTHNHPLLCLLKKGDNKNQCYVCGKTFKSSSYLRVHRDNCKRNNAEFHWKQLSNIEVGDCIKVINKIDSSINKYVKTGFNITYGKYNSFKYKGVVPKSFNENVAAICGYVVGDGWIRTKQNRGIGFVVSDHEKELLPKLIKMIEVEFGVKPSDVRVTVNKPTFFKGEWTNPKEKLHYVNYSNIHLNQMLRFLINKRVPEFVFRSKNSVVSEFLRWLFVADGCVINNKRIRTDANSKYSDRRKSIILTSVDIELLRDVQLLLLRFGIHSRIYTVNTDSTRASSLRISRSESIIKFSKFIGFPLKSKQNKLNGLVKWLNSRNGCGNRSSLSFERVTKISYLDDPQDVYDIEVPKSHKFIANGVVSHNTGKSFMVYNAIANFLKKFPDGVAILDDAEWAYVDFLGSNLGIDTTRFMKFSHSSVEEHFRTIFGGGFKEDKEDVECKINKSSLIYALYNNGVKHIMVAVDSIAAWSTEHERTVGLDKPDMSKAKMVKALFRNVTPYIKHCGLTYFVTNHLIVNIGDMFGPKFVEGSGNAPAYNATVRLCLTAAGKLKNTKTEEITGVIARAQTVKNRFAPPFRTCELEIDFNTGLSRYSGLIALLKTLGVFEIASTGGWYKVVGTDVKFQEKQLPEKWEEIRKAISADKLRMRSADTFISREMAPEKQVKKDE